MENRDFREKWLKTLYDLRLHHLTAAILEALGPLNILGAQLVYLTRPISSPFIAEDQASGLARILEDPSETAAFIMALRDYEP
jgi:hypothetical protein